MNERLGVIDAASGSPILDLDTLSDEERRLVERIRHYETETARVWMRHDVAAHQRGRLLLQLLRRARQEEELSELCMRAVERSSFAAISGDQDTAWERLRIEEALVRGMRRRLT